MEMSTGVIFDVKRFSIHDGPGIRSTVFFKGCPLTCAWCHNPESQSIKPELIFRPSRCLACGECVDACPHEAIQFIDGRIVQDWNLCQVNGACVGVCYPGAREIIGKQISPEAVVQELTQDRVFYQASGGGVTISGGEPLAQPDFLKEILSLCKKEDLSTALDTCGAVDWEDLEDQLPFLDLVLYDLKIIDDTLHKEYTGVSNRQILENFRRLLEYEVDVSVRRPVIPGVNDSEEEIGQLCKYLEGKNDRIKIDLLPYHSLSQDKYLRLGRGKESSEWQTPSPDLMDRIKKQLEEFGHQVGLRG